MRHTKFKITNLQESITNLGTIKGHMLAIGPKQSKEIDEETAELFAKQLEIYEHANFIRVHKIQDKSILKKNTDKVGKQTKNIHRE